MHVPMFSAILGAFALTMLSGCVTSSNDVPCTIEGAQYLSGSENPEQLCASFIQQLDEKLRERDLAEVAKDLSVALRINKRGSIEAHVSRLQNGEWSSLPVVAFDVVDRPLEPGDLERLAGAVAVALAKEH